MSSNLSVDFNDDWFAPPSLLILVWEPFGFMVPTTDEMCVAVWSTPKHGAGDLHKFYILISLGLDARGCSFCNGFVVLLNNVKCV